jgi:hypothetical protein
MENGEVQLQNVNDGLRVRAYESVKYDKICQSCRDCLFITPSATGGSRVKDNRNPTGVSQLMC